MLSACYPVHARDSQGHLMTSSSPAKPDDTALYVLTAVLFIAYLCVGMALPSVPVHVSGTLGFSNLWAGLATGTAFLATLVTRAPAGSFADQRGVKPAVMLGLAIYLVGAWTAAASDLPIFPAGLAYVLLLTGRVLVGCGESLVTVGAIAWGVAVVGPARSGRVLAIMGAAIYGALALGAPVGLALMDRFGFAPTMLIGAALPALGLLAVRGMPGLAPQPTVDRPPFRSVLSRIWLPGSVVGLQGIGFAAISSFFVLNFRALGWSHAALGLTAFGAGFVLVRVFFGSLPDRVGGLRVAIASLAVEAAGQALIWTATDPVHALAGAFLTGLGCSLVFPAMGREVVRHVEPRLRGTAIGGFSAFQDLAYGLTGPLAGLVADRAGYGSVFLIGAVAAAAGLAVAIGLQRARRPFAA